MAMNALPRYIDPAGDPRVGALPVRPPFLFHEVTARVFPLKANIARLSQFCDSYLNMDIPQEIVHYRPALPYVYLMILNYGSMSPSAPTLPRSCCRDTRGTCQSSSVEGRLRDLSKAELSDTAFQEHTDCQDLC
jgi:hypothetical protein